MRFRRFYIEGYRAVGKAEVPVSNNLIPLIGINESGKTSILLAVLAFDRVSDRLNGGAHLEYRNKYEVGDHESFVDADIAIDGADDLEALSSTLRLTLDNPLLKALQECHESKRLIRIRRDLTTRKYSVLDLPEAGENTDRLANALYARLPTILYFDDFTDRVPEAVRFVAAKKKRGYVLQRNRMAAWQRIIEEIFKRATNGKYSLTDFIQITDGDERDSLLHDIKDVLNEEIIEDWLKLGTWAANFADDPDILNLQLRYDKDGTGNFRFEFKVVDRSSKKGRFFSVVHRSKGFQWYFNFLMKLKFNPKYRKEQTGAIYLLDEPGSYLHSSAQDELLYALREISDTNSIVYCTHSQHLLNPDVINVLRTRIVAKEQGEIRVIPFGSAGTDNYSGALTPLYHALQLKTGVFNRTIKYAVVTEGITDFYLFRLLQRHVPDWDIKGVELIPGAGAEHLKELISMCFAWSDDFVVLFDSDTDGTEAVATYTRFFGEKSRRHYFTYRTRESSENVRLEELLSPQDQGRLLKLTELNDVKAAIIALYYLSNDQQSEFLGALTKKSLAALDYVRIRLQSLGTDSA